MVKAKQAATIKNRPCFVTITSHPFSSSKLACSVIHFRLTTPAIFCFTCREVLINIKSNYKRQIMILAGGTAISQVAYLVSLPILSRLYEPSAFGQLAFLQSLLVFLTAVTSLQYEVALLIPEDKESAAALLVLSFCVMCCVSFISTIIIWGLTNPRLGGIHLQGLERYWWLLPVGQLGAGGYQILTQWAIREKQFTAIAKSKMTQVISQICVQIILGVLKIGTFGLLIGDVLGRCSGQGSFALGVWKNRADLFKSLSVTQLIKVAIRYKHFPFMATGSNLLFVGTLQLPPIILITLYGSTVAGQYALAIRIGQAPLLLISKAISQVFMGEAPRLSRDNPQRLKYLFTKNLIALTKIGLLPCLIAFVFSPRMFPVIFGPAWQEAGIFMRLLSPMLFFSFLSYPFLMVLNLLEKQSWQLMWDTSRCILTIGGLLLVHSLQGSASLAILIYSCTMLIMAVVYISLCFYLIESLIRRDQSKAQF